MGGMGRVLVDRCAEVVVLLRSAAIYVVSRPSLRKVIRSILDSLPGLRFFLVRAVLRLPLNRARGRVPICLCQRSDRRPVIFVDISGLVVEDLRTGIQRVVRAILREMLINPPNEYLIAPVYALKNQLGYCLAGRYVSTILEAEKSDLVDEPIQPQLGDIFLILDVQFSTVIRQEAYLKRLHEQGLGVYFCVYDMLPLKYPAWFPEWVDLWYVESLRSMSQYNGALCISRTVADELKVWLFDQFSHMNDRFFIESFQLGADIPNTLPSCGLPAEAESIISIIGSRPSFLMVGTIEPRKGHAQVLDAFEHLWRRESNVNLIIVGKQGWMVESTVERIRSHSEGGKRLFWLEGISDEFLQKIYGCSTCLIAASYDEGYGLPLIEAAHYNLPVMARDIPVFREVAEDHAYYFNAESAEVLAQEINSWLTLFAVGEHPRSEAMRYVTWRESAEQLFLLLRGGVQTKSARR